MPRRRKKRKIKGRRGRRNFEGPTTPSSSEDEAETSRTCSCDPLSLTDLLHSPCENIYQFRPRAKYEPKPFEFYRTIDKRVQVYRNGETFADLFPSAVVWLGDASSKNKNLDQVTIQYPVPFCTIKISDLAWPLEKENTRKKLFMKNRKNKEQFMRKKENYVAWVSCRTSVVEVQRNLLDFVCELLETVCDHKFIDVSYKPGSLIAAYSQHQTKQIDFRNFKFPINQDHVTLYVNLPWFYKQQLLDFLESMLKTADDFDILVDILVLQHYQKTYEDRSNENLKTKCFKTWIWEDIKFYDQEKDQDFSLKRGNTFCGLLSNGSSEHKQRIIDFSNTLVKELKLK